MLDEPLTYLHLKLSDSQASLSFSSHYLNACERSLEILTEHQPEQSLVRQSELRKCRSQLGQSCLALGLQSDVGIIVDKEHL